MIPYLNSSRPSCAPRATIRMSHAERELEPGTEREAAHRGDRRERRLLEPGVATPARARIPATIGVGVTRRRIVGREHVDATAAAGVNTDVSMPLENARPSPMTIERAQVAGVGEQRRAELRASRATSSAVNELSLSGRFSTSRPTWPSSLEPDVSNRIDS